MLLSSRGEGVRGEGLILTYYKKYIYTNYILFYLFILSFYNLTPHPSPIDANN
jgi:hypothetical protein